MNSLHRKLAGKSSILRGEIIHSYPEKTQRTIVSIVFFFVQKLWESVLSFLMVTLYHNMFLRLFFFNSLFLLRLVETELHWNVPLRGRNVTCVPFFWKRKASKSIKKEDQSITTLILTQKSCLGNVLAILPIANVSSRHRWYAFPLFECIGTPNGHWSCRAESRQ